MYEDPDATVNRVVQDIRQYEEGHSKKEALQLYLASQGVPHEYIQKLSNTSAKVHGGVLTRAIEALADDADAEEVYNLIIRQIGTASMMCYALGHSDAIERSKELM